MKENKVWGETALLWSGNNVEVHKIVVQDSGYCSKHKHDYKFNMFHVESGCLQIETWRENGLVDRTIIADGESTTVSPGLFHRFTALEQTTALEVYWVELKSPDIVREDHGGVAE